MKVSEGFSMADSRNLPKVDYMMFLEYMRGNDTFNVAVLFVCLRLHTIEPWSIWVHKRNVYSDTLEQCFYTILTKLLRPMVWFHGMTWKVENEEHLMEDGCAVIVSNHQMSFDLLGMFYIWHKIKKLTAIAKKEMMYLGVVGLVTYLSGVIFVDRKNTAKDYQVLQYTVETIKKLQAKVWIFPEGTRNKAKNVKLLPFKKGAFVIAIGAQAPIIPVVYSPYYFADEKKSIFYNGGKVIMKCLPPIPTKGMTLDDLPKLQEQLHKLILNTFEELTKEVLNELPPDYPLPNKDLLLDL